MTPDEDHTATAIIDTSEEAAKRIYVASSWRNAMQPAVVHALRSAGHLVYDFRHPDGEDALLDGFHWSEVMPSYRRVGPGSPEQLADVTEYLVALDHPTAEQGFRSDFDAMQWADTCVLVLPCGRSAHLEAGWFAADPDRELVILLDGPSITPELMYRMADVIVPTFNDLLGWAGVQPEMGYEAWHSGQRVTPPEPDHGGSREADDD